MYTRPAHLLRMKCPKKRSLFSGGVVSIGVLPCKLSFTCEYFAFLGKNTQKKILKNDPIDSSQCLRTVNFNDICAVVESVLLHTN